LNAVVQGTNLIVGSPEPGLDKDGQGEGNADQRTRTRAENGSVEIGQLQSELQAAQERTGKLKRDLQTDQDRTDKVERDLQQAKNEVERLTLERDFYSDKASALEEENRQLTESATKYSLHAQKLERELTEIATKYSLRAQKLERELTETATKYSLWGQKLERELARIDPDGAPARRFDTPSLLNGASIRLRHEQHISFWKWRITAASLRGIEIANWSSSIRWSIEAY
jgi:archaellum component FlaC